MYYQKDVLQRRNDEGFFIPNSEPGYNPVPGNYFSVILFHGQVEEEDKSVSRVINTSTPGLRLFTARYLESVAEIPGPLAAESQWFPTVLKV